MRVDVIITRPTGSSARTDESASKDLTRSWVVIVQRTAQRPLQLQRLFDVGRFASAQCVALSSWWQRLQWAAAAAAVSIVSSRFHGCFTALLQAQGTDHFSILLQIYFWPFLFFFCRNFCWNFSDGWTVRFLVVIRISTSF